MPSLRRATAHWRDSSMRPHEMGASRCACSPGGAAPSPRASIWTRRAVRAPARSSEPGSTSSSRPWLGSPSRSWRRSTGRPSGSAQPSSSTAISRWSTRRRRSACPSWRWARVPRREAAGSCHRRVGAQQASWLLLSGVTVNADEAVAAGFALARVPAGQALDHALALARQLATHDLTALVANKRLLREGYAEGIGSAWQREKSAIAAVARGAGTDHVARQEIGLSQRCCGLARGAISRRLGPWTSTTSPTTSTGWHPGGSRRAATPAPARPGLLVTGHWRSGSRSSAGRRSLPGWGTDWPASVRRTSRNSSDWAPDSARPRRGCPAPSCVACHAAGATSWRHSSPRRMTSPWRRGSPSPTRSSRR